MKTILFKNKEDYLKLKTRWATYFNTEARTLPMDSYGYKTRKLKAAHFILYAIMRGKDPEICIATCSEETRYGIINTLGGRWIYESKIFKDAFDLNAEQIELLKAEARTLIKAKPTLEATKPEETCLA